MKRSDIGNGDELLAYDLERYFWLVQPTYDAMYGKVYTAVFVGDDLVAKLTEDYEHGFFSDVDEPQFLVGILNGWGVESEEEGKFVDPWQNPHARRIRATIVMSRFATKVICRMAGLAEPQGFFDLGKIARDEDIFEAMRETLDIVSVGLVE